MSFIASRYGVSVHKESCLFKAKRIGKREIWTLAKVSSKGLHNSIIHNKLRDFLYFKNIPYGISFNSRQYLNEPYSNKIFFWHIFHHSKIIFNQTMGKWMINFPNCRHFCIIWLISFTCALIEIQNFLSFFHSFTWKLCE